MSPSKTSSRLRERTLSNNGTRSPSVGGRTTPVTPRKSKPTPKPIEVFHKCCSEPIIFPVIDDGDESAGVSKSLESDEGRWFCRVNTLDDIFLCTDTSDVTASPLARINAGYQKESKVLITVTVEGSPGPIRTLVTLGASVEDTIKVVIQKYREEGRSPRLDHMDEHSRFDLHVSYFSLQCLDRSDAIGDVGSRSFYLRKSNRKNYEENLLDVAASSMISTSEFMHSGPPVVVLPSFVPPNLKKFIRRMHRVFILLGCLHSR